ncbi:MAG: hypothetical protein WCL37_00905 [Chrysiogenales bacterium]
MEKKIVCVFCKGTGQAHFALPVKPAARQAEVAEPAIKCAFCAAAGVYPRNALVSCIFCNGKGMVAFTGATNRAKIQVQYNG